MLKREELSNPRSCMSRAKSHEMCFVLLARDATAPHIVRMWAKERLRLGKNKPGDEQITEALACAETMQDQHSGIRLQLLGEERGVSQVANEEGLPQYVIVSDGEGAEACIIAGEDLHESVHRFMCVCGKTWRKCDSSTQHDIEEIDDADKWARDESGKLFSICWPHETGRLTLYRLTGAPITALANHTERMWTLIRAFVLNETNQTSYAELRGSQSMDIPCEFLALCEFAEEMGVKLP